MQTLLSDDRKIHEDVLAKPSLLSQSGPFFLSAAFTVLIFKCASSYWPLLLIALVGYGANRLWKKKGFNFSLVGLATASIFTIHSGVDPFWVSLLSISIALSWLLTFLGRQEREAFILNRQEKIDFLEESRRRLERQLREAKSSHLEESKRASAETKHLNDLYAQTTLFLGQANRSLEISEKERGKSDEKCEALSREILSYQEQKANQEEVQPQYVLLREQFDEKSEALNKSRKELFQVENAFLALQKAQEEKVVYEVPEEEIFLMRDLQRLEEECRDLELQVVTLQNLISTLLNPKKAPSRSRKSPKTSDGQERLPLLIQEKIDQTNPQFLI